VTGMEKNIFGARGAIKRDERGDRGRGIFSETLKWKKRRSGECAIGECRDGCAVRYTYGRLLEDAEAFSHFMPACGRGTMLVGGDAYEIAVTVLAASATSCRLILCDPKLHEAAVEKLLGNEMPELVISSGKPPLWMDKSSRHFDALAFSAIVTGEISGGYRDCKNCGEGFVLSFLTEKGIESYTEETLMFLTGMLADMTSFGRRETVMCDAEPYSSTGLICTALTSILRGGCGVFLKDKSKTEEYMHLVRPSRLHCSTETAHTALAVLKRCETGALAMPAVTTKRRGGGSFVLVWERTALSMRRRLSASRIMRLGGSLRYVALFGSFEERVCRELADFGIVSAGVLSGYGYPFAALRKWYDRNRYWTLPRGMLADICDVKRGGKGRIILSGEGLRMLSGEPILRGCVPGRYRFDGWEGLSLVTDLYGFVLPKGNIFVEKRFFC